MAHEQPKPTGTELSILRVLWELGPVTVKQVHEVLGQDRELAYTGVLRMMQIMHEKGLLKRDESARSHVYWPTHSKTAMQKGLLSDLMEKAFGGSAKELMLAALDAGKVSDSERAEIRKLLGEKKG